MDFDDYVKHCIAEDGTPTPYNLVIGRNRDLLQSFRCLRNDSEREGRERGFHLHWNKTFGMAAAGSTIVGNAQNVSLGTKLAHNHPSYIGDCHTHPYHLKMGPLAQIGPSVNDYEDVWPYPPHSFPIAVYFVLSGSTVFLIFRRKMSLSTFSVPKDGITEGAWQCILLDSKPKLAEALGQAGELKYSSADNWFAGLKAEKTAWQNYAPSAAREFSEDNLQMNLEMARHLHFEYYSGNLDSNEKFCQLDLKSNLLYLGLVLLPSA
jgi:hypothetical protein